MPRISDAARGAAAYRARAGVVEPPRHLTADTADLWRQIVLSRPTDHFDAASAPLLEFFCALAIHGRAVTAKLAKAKIDSPEAGDLERRAALVTKCLCSLATKLRISVQARIRSDSGRNDERGLGDAGDDPLIGGAAVWGRKQ